MSPTESADAPPPAGITGVVREAPHLTRMLRVLARHGVLGALRGERHWPPPAQVREALEELGVVFLKFGQVLAVRRDLLPAAYVAELELLHDRLPAMPAADVEAVVAGALGAPAAELFASFAAEPMAAATIAQVHEATRPDGRHVVVKVRRTGLDEHIAEDTATLAYLAAVAAELMPGLRRLDPQLSVVELFRREVGRVASGRYSPGRWLAAGRAFAQDAERFLRGAPADLRRTLQRVSEGDFGRVHAPGLEDVGRRASRDIERLTGAVAAATFVIAGALLVPAGGWHRAVGDALLAIGILGTATVAVGALLAHRR